MNQELTSLDIRRYRYLLDDIIADPVNLSPVWLEKHTWAAVPVEERITEIDAEWIANAASRLGIKEAIAISTRPDSNPECFAVPMTQAGLLNFQYRLIPFPFLLIPENRQFGILHDGDYCFVIAGPRKFVRTGVGCSLRTARIMFRERYAKDFYSEKTREVLLGIADRYEMFNGEISLPDDQPIRSADHHQRQMQREKILPLPQKRYCQLLVDILETEVELNLEWLTAQQWVAVPLSAPINEMTAEWLAEAAASMAIRKCIALSTNPSAPPSCLEVPMTQSTLIDFENRTRNSHYLLLPEDRRFAVLHEGRLFVVVAGPRSFVRTAVGCSFPTAFMIFRNRLMATKYDSEEEEAIIEKTAARYESLSGHDADV